MRNKILWLAVLSSFISYGCANASDNSKSNASKYLEEAKACYSDVNPIASEDLMPSRNVRAKLSLIDIEDYLGERFFGSEDLTIQFRKVQENEVFFYQYNN